MELYFKIVTRQKDFDLYISRITSTKKLDSWKKVAMSHEDHMEVHVA